MTTGAPDELVIEASAAFESSSGQILVLSEEQYRKLEENGFVSKSETSDRVTVENVEVVEAVPEAVNEDVVVQDSEENPQGQDAVVTGHFITGHFITGHFITATLSRGHFTTRPLYHAATLSRGHFTPRTLEN